MQMVEIAEDKLPATYQNAKRALAECVRIDEAKDWTDKAIALACYAKQANDDKLLAMSNRIKARAVLRMGELFNEIEPGINRYDSRQGGESPANRKEAADAAGVSQDQRKQAQRIANLPRDEVDALIESDDPPTLSAFDRMARAHPAEMRATSSLLGEAKSFARFCENHSAKSLVVALAPHERAALMQHATIIVNWLTEIAGEL
jgi:hypothetical protein